MPYVDYADKPIPHFTHSGSGFQLLDNLGSAFGINDYIWYQLPDGDVYVAAAEKSLFAGKAMDFPAGFSQRVAGGNFLSLPVIQSPAARRGNERGALDQSSPEQRHHDGILATAK